VKEAHVVGKIKCKAGENWAHKVEPKDPPFGL